MADKKIDKEKKHEHKVQHGVYKAGEKYHCGECGAELDMGKDCPGCKAELDWTKIVGNVRRPF